MAPPCAGARAAALPRGAAALLGAAAAQSLSFDFDGAAPLHRVSPRYVCFNIDTGSLYNGMNFSDAVFRQLVANLALGGAGAGSIIRIGGTAVDSSFYFPDAPYHIGAPNQCGGNCPNGSSDIGNAMLTAVFEFIVAVPGMSLLWDVNGESFRQGNGPWSAAGNATAMLAFIEARYGGKIDFAYSVGNEPDLWKISPPVSAATLGTDALAMKAALAPLNIGRGVYGSSWARISTDDALGFMPVVVAGGGIEGYTVHNYPYGGRDCIVANYLNKSKVTADLYDKLAAVAAVKAATPGAESLLLVLEETAGSSGGGCDNVTDRFVAGFCWMNTLMTVGRAGFDRVHRQDIAGWSFAFGMSHYQLVGPPGWVVGSELLTPHPDYFTTLLWRQIVGDAVLATTVAGGAAAQAGVELGVWCASETSPFGAGTVVMPYVNTLNVSVAISVPASLLGAATVRFSLTAPGGDLQADGMLLNGELLALNADGSLKDYPISGKLAPAAPQVTVEAFSYGFVAYEAPIGACAAAEAAVAEAAAEDAAAAS